MDPLVTVVILDDNYAAHFTASVKESSLRRNVTINAVLEPMTNKHRKSCCNRTLANTVWATSSQDSVDSQESLMALHSVLCSAQTSGILAQVPKVAVLYLRLGNPPRDGHVSRSSQAPTRIKRKLSSEATSSQKRRELATSLAQMDRDSKIFQVVSSSKRNSDPTWERRGDFANTLETPGAVLVDNSAPLGIICNKALRKPNSRVCLVFASPSEFSAKRFSSTLAFAYDATRRAQCSALSQKIDFFRKLPGSSHCVLQLDFTWLLDQPENGPRFKESMGSIQIILRKFIVDVVGTFVDSYRESIPSLRDFPGDCKPGDIILTLLDRLSKGELTLLVCVHAFEQVLERATICSLWEPSGIHASIRPLITTVDDILFAPIADSYEEKGVVRKVVITGTHPSLYLDATRLNGLDPSDVSLALEALPLHGFTRRTYRSVLQKVWEMYAYTGTQTDNFEVALNACHDELWGTIPTDSIASESAPIDPGALILTTELLDKKWKLANHVGSSSREPAVGQLTVEDLDTHVKLQKRYQATSPMLFPVVVRNMPAWLTNLVKPGTDDSEYPFVEIPDDCAPVWSFKLLETSPRDDGTSLPFALLQTLGLLRVRRKNEKTDACVAGRHAKQTLEDLIDAVNKYNNKRVSPLAQIPVEAFTLHWLQNALLKGLKDKSPPMKTEAAFQDFALEFLQDFLQHNGQWRHQAQAEPWLRCSTEEKCFDQRGDIIMLLKLSNGRWHVHVIELKFFEAQTTAAVTQERIQKVAPQRALPKEKSDLRYFEAVLRYSASKGLLGSDCVSIEAPELPDFVRTGAFTILRGDLWADYYDREKKCTERKSGAATLSYAKWQSRHYVGGAVQGVGEELGADKPGIADVRFTTYEASESVIVVFIPIALLLISNVLLYGWEGKGNEKKPADFRPAVAGVYPWTKAPTVADIQRIRKDKEDSRKPVNA